MVRRKQGRPHRPCTPASLERNLIALRRLRVSVELDTRLSTRQTNVYITAIDRVIERLSEYERFLQ